MKAIVEKLKGLEQDLADARGAFFLFALLLREDSPNRWDLLVGADWLSDDKDAGLNFIGEGVRSRLQREEITLLSRIVVLDQENPVALAIASAVSIQHGCAYFTRCAFNGLDIAEAYVITAARPGSQSPQAREPVSH